MTRTKRLLLAIILLLIPVCSGCLENIWGGSDNVYRRDSVNVEAPEGYERYSGALAPTDAVMDYYYRKVEPRLAPEASPVDKVRLIIRLINTDDYFIKLDRSRLYNLMKNKGPETSSLSRGVFFRLEQTINVLDDRSASEVSRNVIHDAYTDFFYLNLVQGYFGRHPYNSADLPFIFSADDIFRYHIKDGCTSTVKTFIALARAAGFKKVYMVYAVVDHYYNQACGTGTRSPRVIMHGHQFALMDLAKAGDLDRSKWFLVNVTRFDPGADSEEQQYEIIPLGPIFPDLKEPADLIGRSIDFVPSFRSGPLYYDNLTVFAAGRSPGDDLGVDSLEKAMNLSASGSIHSSVCRWSALPQPPDPVVEQ